MYKRGKDLRGNDAVQRRRLAATTLSGCDTRVYVIHNAWWNYDAEKAEKKRKTKMREQLNKVQVFPIYSFLSMRVI